MREHRQIQRVATLARARPRQNFSLAPALGVLGVLFLALACGRGSTVDPRQPSEDEGVVAWALGRIVRVTHTGDSEATLLVIKATSAGSTTLTHDDVRAPCGEIEDILPSHPGTGEYFFLVDGRLQMGKLGKAARRRPVAIDMPIRIKRLLLIGRSLDPRVLLVEQAPPRGQERGRLWRLSVTERNGKLHATAQHEHERAMARYRREFRNARCKAGGRECLRTGVDAQGNSVIDREPRPGAPAVPYQHILGVTVYRVVFHPDQPDTLLLLTSCPEQ